MTWQFFFFQAEDGIRVVAVTGVQTCALPIYARLDDGSRVNVVIPPLAIDGPIMSRSEEHTSELQSRLHLVCRLLLEKKKTHYLESMRYVRSDTVVLRTPRMSKAHAYGITSDQ